MIRAVYFDVDFTLIYPGPTFQGEGYQRFCAKYGIEVDPAAFGRAVASASSILDRAQDHFYDPQIFVDYTSHIIKQMGGHGPGVTICAREIYEEWAACQHFSLYDDVPDVLRTLHAAGLRLGLISNTHRSLAAFQNHFELEGLISAALSSSEHGYMKPHPSIFEAALRLLDVAPEEAVMVGDSLRQDVDGARRIGMRGVLVRRSAGTSNSRSGPVPTLESARDGVPVIASLTELPPLILSLDKTEVRSEK
ncbi:MAG: HAD-IIIA family hydrolase [Acidobacteria bacterium]|nr:HAD-IIIA family hydrolase [Acidobacteriota bacterium]